MIILKYTGSDLNEIQSRIIEELGPFAIILFTRTIETGFLSRLFNGLQHEVTIGIEEADYEKQKQGLKPTFIEKRKSELFKFDKSEEKDLIQVTGAIPFNEKQKNIIFLTGQTTVNKASTVIKLSLKWEKEFRTNIELISLGDPSNDEKQQLSSFASIFQLNYHTVSDKENLNEIIESSSSKLFLVLISEEKVQTDLSYLINKWDFHTLLLTLKSTFSIEEQVKETNKYSNYSIFGLVYSDSDEKPSLLFLEELFQKQSIPISYFIEGSEAKLADLDSIHTRIINEKLNH